MRILVAALLLWLLGGASTPAAEIERLVRDLRFPEGPVDIDDRLFFTEYAGHTVLRLDDGRFDQVWERNGCGPSGLAPAPEGLLVACYDSGEVAIISRDGDTREIIKADETGQSFQGPNDFAADARGGTYISASGPWETAPIVGKIFYRAADRSIREVAADLHYANGVALAPDGKRLYVAETYAYRVISFAVGEDGSLTDRREWARMATLAGEPGALMAPDGLKVDSKGNLIIALFEGGAVLMASPEAKLLAKIAAPVPHVPNLVLAPDGRSLIFAGVEDGSKPPYPGALYRTPYPLAGP